ncbi:uncharacterized protein LOC125545096 isoform X2 [Triticum urartu]|uniref:uncharacterized protein LOC125545094 isoform X2 n=1 Tax=Triticum urartu TaxID=4572 RepID=UPI002044041C|nr:uncharacterized protein LOC125545094 isoform X2 [Triticum urartu]XP_048564921.1 uncharacterized protein LOC125545096 isoform X2 [Triticum urartu]
MVKTFNSVHHCSKKWQVRAFTAKYIANKYVEKIRANERMTLKGLAALVQEDSNMTIKRGKLGRARGLAFNIIYGDEIAQYNKLWDYANELRRSNPGSTFYLDLVEDGQFEKCYFSFDACKRGFLSACRPVLFLDGCHLKTQYGGILLSAVGMDPNDCIIPIAHAVVQREDTKAWRWFLTTLKKDLGIVNNDLWTIMSDKQKGLIKAVKELFSGSPHRFCVRHLWQNFNKNFKGEALKNQLWKCARSSTEGKFRHNMNEMLVLNKEAHDWLEELDPPTWVRAFQNEFPKCDVLLNNNCEVFNKYILDAREMPIISMCQRIKGQLMGRNHSKLQEALKWPGTICPKIRKKLDKNVEFARTCYASPAGLGIFNVNDRGVDYGVDYQLRKCSCRRWDLSGIPCSHGVAALRYDKINPEDYVKSCYSIATYRKAYENIIMPCRDISEWSKMNGRTIAPPPLVKQKGRRRKNRRKQPKEKQGKKGVKITRAGAIIHCSYCGVAGHNIGGCMDFKLGLKPKKKSERVRVRAEPDVSSSSDEEEAVVTQNQRTEGLIQEPVHLYQPEIINILTQEREASQREASQREAVHQGPLPNSVFIEEHIMSQPPVIPTTATKEGNVHRKREVLALAKLRAAAEKREVADLAKFEAAMAKLKEEEDKIKLAAQKRKEELEAKKQAAEEKKKTILEEKRLAAEEKRRATEEKKKKAQEEKLEMAEKKRQMMDERKRNAEIEKQKKAEEKRRIAEEKKMIANTKYQQEEAAFLIHQAEEFERQESWRKFKEAEEAARQNAWEQQNNQQDTTRNEEWELRKRRAEETNKKAMDDQMADQVRKQVVLEEQMKERAAGTSSRIEEARFNPCVVQGNKTKKKTAPTNQNMTCFKKPRKVNMFDEFR